MAQFVMIRHKVKDFDAWKVGFDAHAGKRSEAGLFGKHLRETMQKFGVADKPDVYFLSE
jgi:hypothetical protein